MILLKNLAALIADGIEDIGLLKPYHADTVEVLGGVNEGNITYSLQKVTIKNVPVANTWIFESESTGDECLRGGGKTVEKTVLHLQDNRLYVLMVEMKSKIYNCKLLRKVKQKYECSLVRITTYLSENPKFNFPGVSLYPVGILCYNKDDYSSDVDDTSTICKGCEEYKTSAKNPCIVEIKPITLETMRIPVFFAQNPAYAANPSSTSDSFGLDFKEVIDKL